MTRSQHTALAALLGIAICAGQPGGAQRAGDEMFTPEGLEQALAGQAVEFFDGSVARYGPGTDYSYTYQPGDPPFRGTYGTTSDSQVCVEFDNGFSRCDTYVLAGDRLILIIADGTRFPVRRISALE